MMLGFARTGDMDRVGFIRGSPLHLVGTGPGYYELCRDTSWPHVAARLGADLFHENNTAVNLQCAHREHNKCLTVATT